MNLFQLTSNRPARVVDIVGGHGLRRKLQGLGLRIGSRLVKSRSMAGPVVVRVGRTELAIGRGMASKIIVEEE